MHSPVHCGIACHISHNNARHGAVPCATDNRAHSLSLSRPNASEERIGRPTAVRLRANTRAW